MDIAIWTEATREIGLGHLTRSLNIASAMKFNKMNPVLFVNDDEVVTKLIEGSGFDYEICSLDGSSGFIPSCTNIVVDSKRELKGLIAALKKYEKRVTVIDNIGEGTGEADAVIVPNPLVGSMPWKKNLHSGPEFIIIGENFHDMRRKALKDQYSLPFEVLISMGGSDPNGVSALITKALWNTDNVRVTVVIGPAMDDTPLKEFEEMGNKHFIFLRGIDDLAPLMQTASVGFTAMGNTVYEFAYMGVPSVVIGNYEEDKEDFTALERLGFAKILGYHKDVTEADIRDSVVHYIEHRKLWERISDKSCTLTDGHGAERIADIIKKVAEG